MLELILVIAGIFVLAKIIGDIVTPKATEIAKGIVVEEVKQNGGDGCAVLIVFGLALGVVVGGVALVLA